MPLRDHVIVAGRIVNSLMLAKGDAACLLVSDDGGYESIKAIVLWVFELMRVLWLTARSGGGLLLIDMEGPDEQLDMPRVRLIEKRIVC